MARLSTSYDELVGSMSCFNLMSFSCRLIFDAIWLILLYSGLLVLGCSITQEELLLMKTIAFVD